LSESPPLKINPKPPYTHLRRLFNHKGDRLHVEIAQTLE